MKQYVTVMNQQSGNYNDQCFTLISDNVIVMMMMIVTMMEMITTFLYSRTVKKDGPNQGRLFHACPKPMGQGCSFFQWADEDGPPAQSRGFGTTGRGTGRGRGVGRGSGGSKKRKCGNCRMEGRNIPYVYLQYEHRGV